MTLSSSIQFLVGGNGLDVISDYHTVLDPTIGELLDNVESL